MKFYIAARYSRREEAKEIARKLEAAGFLVTSRWIEGDHEAPNDKTITKDFKLSNQFANEDLQDIYNADAILCLTEYPDSIHGRGGRHVEFGVAMALTKKLFIIGPVENIFYASYRCARYENIETMIGGLRHNDR